MIRAVHRSVYAKMVAVLLGLVLFLGASFVLVSLSLTRRWEEEVIQRVNRELAKNLVGQDVLLVDGEVNEAALERVFRTLSLINPSIEVYLLDLDGNVVTHSAPPGHLERERVSVEPIERFLAGEVELPITGDDPRDLEGRKVFSVSPIMVEDRYEGYLYVVLAGEQYDSVVEMVQRNHALRLGLMVVAGALLVALVAGVALFELLTRRLRVLAGEMEEFRDSDFARPTGRTDRRTPEDGDEIDRLGSTFDRMSERIIQQMQKLKQTDALRRELVANVSHDLRTPLASLQGYLETLDLKNGDLDLDTRRRYLRVASSQGQKLSDLVEELFELARLESTEMRPDVEPFPLAELVQDVVQDFQLQAADDGVDLAADLPREVPPVAADIALMQRVLQNLIGNALAHTERGGQVRVRLVHDADTVTVRVEDTGCGIPERDLVRVFDRFYRSGGTETRCAGGLGLAIVKRILELHGSAVETTSTVGEGTAFRFSLPAAT